MNQIELTNGEVWALIKDTISKIESHLEGIRTVNNSTMLRGKISGLSLLVGRLDKFTSMLDRGTG